MRDPVAGRTKRQRPEHLAQAAFVKAVRLCAGECVQIWSIPNEHPEAWIGWLVALGLTAGAPDLIVLWGQGQVGFIEWKAPRGPISKSQSDVHAWLARHGFRFGVSRSQEEGWALLREWGVPMQRQMLFDPSVGMVVKRPAPRAEGRRMKPAQVAERVGDALEAACGHWLALPIFTAGFLAGASVNIDVANIAISYITAGLLFLTINRDRRSNQALHAKLDDLEVSSAEADSGNVRLEERPEEEIEAKRKGASQ